MARLALIGKGVSFRRRKIDIMDRNEQFAPRYVVLGPRTAIAPLRISTEAVADTIPIVNRVQSIDGPDLADDETTRSRLSDNRAASLQIRPYLLGDHGALADCYVKAAPATSAIHRLSNWRPVTSLKNYFAKLKANSGFVTPKVIKTRNERNI